MYIKISVVTVGLSMAITACGGSGSADSTLTSSEPSPTSSNAQDTRVQDLVGELPDGDITHYGSITVGDDAGMASDLVAAFFKLNSGVSAEALSQAFSSGQTLCSVDDDDVVDFEEISVGFIPSFNGVGKQPISAGESIILGSQAGTFATIQSQSAGPFLFYTLPDSQVLPNHAIPDGLQVDITGSEFPGYQAALLPNVDRLENVVISDDGSISSASQLTWTPSSQPGALVRIFASTAGGFFTEDGMTVTCLAPDTGSFEFPIDTKEELGANFVAEEPIVSRIAISTEFKGNSVLFLIRESFAI